LKENYRIWALRLLTNSTNKPLRWSVSKAVKDHLDEIAEKSVLIGRKRAELYFYEVQRKMDCGLMRDTRPHRAQTRRKKAENPYEPRRGIYGLVSCPAGGIRREAGRR
jgi:hypothetical protein